MSNLKSVSGAMAVGLLLLGWASTWSVSAIAQEAIDPVALGEYNAKLERGREVQSQLNGREVCLKTRHDALSERSKVAEVKLGELQRKANELNSQEANLQSSNAALMADYQSLRAQQDSLFNQRRALLAQLEQEQRRYEDCMYAAWFPPAALVCLAVQAIIKEASGQERILQGHLQAIDQKLSSTNAALQDSQRKLEEARRTLAGTQMEANRTSVERNAIETEIVQLKATIKVLNEESQKYRVLLSDFSMLIADSSKVGGETNPQKLTRFSKQVDEAIANSLTLLQQTNAALPAESRQQCAVQ